MTGAEVKMSSGNRPIFFGSAAILLYYSTFRRICIAFFCHISRTEPERSLLSNRQADHLRLGFRCQQNLPGLSRIQAYRRTDHFNTGTVPAPEIKTVELRLGPGEHKRSRIDPRFRRRTQEKVFAFERVRNQCRRTGYTKYGRCTLDIGTMVCPFKAVVQGSNLCRLTIFFFLRLPVPRCSPDIVNWYYLR
ncbi:MAG: hypothetical protein BWY31_00487 [Lentisphaerae bacterium ADurb.Bin242]|nr:MAG: hypothetical protein BWY31_00487 [Lentisphaerae bacterium ADurb.Bin242]